MRRWPERSTDLLLLTCAAGMLDALSYIRGHAFTANMTGNTVLLGLSIDGHDRYRVLPCLIALAGFLGGVALAAGLSRRSHSEPGPAEMKHGLALELLVLCIFCVVWLGDPGGNASPTPRILLGVGACALGIQSVAVRRLRISDVVTTFITGTMTAALADAISGEHSSHDDGDRANLLLAAMFVSYLAAAALGALLYDWQRRLACFGPLLASGIVVVRCRR